MVELTLNHELGWAITIDNTIEALWMGTIEPMFDGPHQSFRRMIGYIEHGKEVIFNDKPERIHVG